MNFQENQFGSIPLSH